MAEKTEGKTRRAPRGVILIGSLLIVMAFFAAGLGLLVPTSTLEQQPGLTRPLLVSFAIVTSILAYGMLWMRRWAWAATLSFVIVQAIFIVLGALIDGAVQYVGLLLLAVIAGYMLLPQVRTVFLQPRGR